MTNWLPGQIVVGAALFLSVLYLLVSRRSAPGSGASGARAVEDLTAKYESLLNELKEHTANKHLLPEDAWAAQKARLERDAVAVLKSRDSERHESLKAEARAEKRATVSAGGGSTMKGVFIGAGSVGFFVVIWFLMVDSVKPRTEGMTSTGATPPGAAGPNVPPPDDTKLKAMFAAVQSRPDDLEALADITLHLLRRQGFDEARPFIARGTAIDPFHVRLRVARTVMKAVEGSIPAAQAELERLGASYSEAYDANLFAGLIAMDQQNQRRALDAFDRYFAVAPPGDTPPMMKMAVEQMRQQLPPSP